MPALAAPGLSKHPLVRGCLLIATVLCALAHGPLDETHTDPPAFAVTANAPHHETPHSPHGHHGGEECVPGGVLRAPAAQTVDQPSAADAAPLLASLAPVTTGKPWPGRRRPHRRRRARTGRTALARTARWRI